MSVGPTALPAENIPPEVQDQLRGEARAHVTRALEGLVPPEASEEAIGRVLAAMPMLVVRQQAEITSIQHTGNTPHPQILQGYEQVLQGSAERMIKMAEKDQDAYIASNRRQQLLDAWYKYGSLAAGVVGLALIIYGVIRLAEGGHDWAAGALAGMGAAGIVTAFVNARHDKAAPPAAAPSNPQGGA